MGRRIWSFRWPIGRVPRNMTASEGDMAKKLASALSVSVAVLSLLAAPAAADDKASAAKPSAESAPAKAASPAPASPTPAASASAPAAGPTAAATSASAPAPAPAAKPAAPAAIDASQTDEGAGKGVDMMLISHSPKDGSPYLGPKDAVVVVNVFSDFQCPVCKRAADPVKQLVVDFLDRVKVVFRDNALEMHGRSKPLALAAMA